METKSKQESRRESRESRGPIDGVDHIGIRVAALGPALELFVDGFGLDVVHRGAGGPDNDVEFAFLNCGEIRIELFEDAEQSTPATLDHVAVSASGGLDDALRLLAERGVTASGDELEGIGGERVQRLDPQTTGEISFQVFGEAGDGR